MTTNLPSLRGSAASGSLAVTRMIESPAESLSAIVTVAAAAEPTRYPSPSGTVTVTLSGTSGFESLITATLMFAVPLAPIVTLFGIAV